MQLKFKNSIIGYARTNLLLYYTVGTDRRLVIVITISTMSRQTP